MPTSLWRSLALLVATISLIVVIADAVNWSYDTTEGFNSTTPGDDGYATVIYLDGDAAQTGGLRAGDRIIPASGSFSARETASTWPAGTRLHWHVRRGATSFDTTTTVSAASGNDLIFFVIVQCFRFAMILVAVVVAARRADSPEARALVVFLIAIGLGGYVAPGWLPDALMAAAAALKSPIIIIGLGYAALFACLFPATSGRGIRAIIRRVALPVTYAIAAYSVGISIIKDTFQHGLMPHQNILTGVVQYLAYTLMGLMVVAFAVGAFAARGPDRRRALWASGSVIVGFSGVIVVVVGQTLNISSPWLQYVQLTIIVIPIGLGYTILRHRMIDVGFVISRALVLTVISFIVVAAFGLLERALGKIFIDMSHVASRTVEIALALGLGFSLRTLHVRVERGVDYLFFRGRQRSLAALRAFQRDVFYISDPGIVVEQTIELLMRHADAAEVRIVNEVANTSDDPLFIRLRASRQAVKLRDTGTAIPGELAFPMVVRGSLTGALIVGAKRTGETYDPTERDLLAEIAQRVGIALDALQTTAIRAELEALRTATGGVVPAF